MGNNSKFIFYFCISVCMTVISARQLNILTLDESWICGIKKSCVDCLQFSQCSWCGSENKCFSDKLPQYQNYCNEERVQQVNYAMSLADIAKCACDPDHLNRDSNCKHPAVPGGPECSDRGKCLCGRCFCNDTSDPSKIVMGEFCEYDNFSCNDTKCNEGPYNIYELQTNEENNKNGE